MRRTLLGVHAVETHRLTRASSERQRHVSTNNPRIIGSGLTATMGAPSATDQGGSSSAEPQAAINSIPFHPCPPGDARCPVRSSNRTPLPDFRSGRGAPHNKEMEPEVSGPTVPGGDHWPSVTFKALRVPELPFDSSAIQRSWCRTMGAGRKGSTWDAPQGPSSSPGTAPEIFWSFGFPQGTKRQSSRFKDLYLHVRRAPQKKLHRATKFWTSCIAG